MDRSTKQAETALAFAKRLNERGLDFEEWCANFLEAHGYAVRFVRQHEIWASDLVVEPEIPIEVNGSTRRNLSGGKQGYGFLLHKANRSRPIHEPVVALVCHDPTLNLAYYFFVPTGRLRDRHYLEFRHPEPSQAAGDLLEFYQSFGALDTLGAVCTKD